MIKLITYAMIAGFVALPPAQYDHAPTVAYTVDVLPKEQFDATCGVERAPRYKLGCTIDWLDAIFIRDDLSDDAFKRVLRHEIGHINGWGSHHERR